MGAKGQNGCLENGVSSVGFQPLHYNEKFRNSVIPVLLRDCGYIPIVKWKYFVAFFFEKRLRGRLLASEGLYH